MILVHRSHWTRKWHEMNGWERQKAMDIEMEKGEDRDMYGGEGGNDRGQKAGSTAGNNEDDSGGGVQEASCYNRVWLLFMLRHSIIHVTASTEGGGESLQVDELVHQQQGARQAGQAGFRATTVTTRVASWNWPGETRGGETETRRQTEGEKGSRRAGGGGTTSKDSSQKRGGWGRERREEQGEEFTHLIVWTHLWRNGSQKNSIQLLTSHFQANEGDGWNLQPSK